MYIYYYYLEDVLRIGSEESNLIAMQLCGFVESHEFTKLKDTMFDVPESNIQLHKRKRWASELKVVV